MEKPKEVVFVTQDFDGQEFKSTYHIPICLENYIRLEILRRKLNLENLSQVVTYLFQDR